MSFWEFDTTEPLITPERVMEYYRQLAVAEGTSIELPDVLVATFQHQALEHLARRAAVDSITRWPSQVFWPLGRGSFRGRPVAVARLPMGAPAAAAALDLMIAAGVRTVLLAGSAGSISGKVSIGSLVVLSESIRHEGTSHHYVPSGAEAIPSADLVKALSAAALRLGESPPVVGRSWTTDAVYRECTGAATRLSAEGVLVVEMEASALFAVAAHRHVRVGAIVAVSDELLPYWTPGFHTLAYRRALLRAADIALEATS